MKNKIEALVKFNEAYRKLVEEFDNEFMAEDYPFTESFDEISVGKWIENSIDRIKIHEYKKKFLRFKNSRVLMSFETIKKILDFEICSDSAYVYQDTFYIEVTQDGSFWTIAESEDFLSDSLEECELWLFENWVKNY